MGAEDAVGAVGADEWSDAASSSIWLAPPPAASTSTGSGRALASMVPEALGVREELRHLVTFT